MKTLYVNIISSGLSWRSPIDVSDIDDYVQNKWLAFQENHLEAILKESPELYAKYWNNQDNEKPAFLSLHDRIVQDSVQYSVRFTPESLKDLEAHPDVHKELRDACNELIEEAHQLVYDKVQWEIQKYQRGVL